MITTVTANPTPNQGAALKYFVVPLELCYYMIKAIDVQSTNIAILFTFLIDN